MQIAKIGVGVVVLLALLAVAVSYSWTFTPLGRLEYGTAIIAKLGEWNTAPMDFSAEARASANDMVASAMPAGSEVAKIEDRTIDSGGVKIPIRIYWPKAEGKLPVYLDIHGGGWWMGDDFSMESVTKNLANEAGIIIVSVDYRLAPEHPYPRPSMTAMRRSNGYTPTQNRLAGIQIASESAAAVRVAISPQRWHSVRGIKVGHRSNFNTC